MSFTIKYQGKASILYALFFVLCVGFARVAQAQDAAMKLTSPNFENDAYIPKKFTCEGINVNPALVIENVPAKAKSLALIVDDPDAPVKTWVHWVVFDMPVISRINENTIPGKQGVTDFGSRGYKGPCPPFGAHRYFFKIYALDIRLELPETINKAALEKAMQGHILEEAELVGLYKRQE